MKDSKVLSKRQMEICKIALMLIMIIWENLFRIARNGAIGVKIQMMAFNRASVNQPYHLVCMDKST